ncbi:MAG: hypothetical protein ACOY3P_07025 [Planctomycetota bacterium]
MKATLLLDMSCDPSPANPQGIMRAGEEIDHPDAYMLVRMGVAEPSDDECAARHGLSPEQLAAARQAYRRVSAGIHPEDYALFDREVITGYAADGSYLPGPNWEDPEDDGEQDSDR